MVRSGVLWRLGIGREEAMAAVTYLVSVERRRNKVASVAVTCHMIGNSQALTFSR